MKKLFFGILFCLLFPAGVLVLIFKKPDWFGQFGQPAKDKLTQWFEQAQAWFSSLKPAQSEQTK